jgi:hypothetical protein
MKSKQRDKLTNNLSREGVVDVYNQEFRVFDPYNIIDKRLKGIINKE